MGQNRSGPAHMDRVRAILTNHGGLVAELEWKQIGIGLHYTGPEVVLFRSTGTKFLMFYKMYDTLLAEH